MRSPTYALIWEQWRQVRTPIAFSLLLTAIASWTLRQIMELSLGPNRKWLQADSADWGDASTVLAGICMVLVMAALLFAHSSTRDLRMGLPARMLTVPMSSLRLAVTQIVFRLFAVALVALAIGLALTLIDSWYAQMVAPLVGFSVLAYAYASLVATTIGKRNPVVAFVAIVFTISPVIASLLAIEHLLTKSGGFGLHVFGVFVVVCVVLSVYRFATIRNTSPVQVLLLTREAVPAYRTSRKENVAQYKFEWRRIAWIYPSFTAGLLFMFGFPLLFAGYGPRRFENFLEASLLVIHPVVAFIVGMILIAREHRDSVTGVARFMWTRPLTVQQVVLHRMKAVALSILYTYAFIGALALLVALIEGELASIRLDDAILGLALVTAILVGVWSLVWVPYLPIVYWLAVFPILGSTTRMWGVAEDIIAIWIPSLVFWFAFIVLAAYCYRRMIFESRVIARLVIFCLALAFVSLNVYFFAFNRRWELAWQPSQFVPGAISLSALPLFVLLWQGFFLDRLRHNALFRRLPARDS